MQEITLAYGRSGLRVNIPDQAQVFTPHFVPGLPDEPAAIRAALRNPIGSPALSQMVHPGQKVVVVHTDITRATPNDRLLPVLLAELEAAGIAPADITLLNGLGTHRPQTDAELRQMLGSAVVDRYRCIQHNCYDDANLVSLGETSLGHPVRINRTYLEADVRILTGFIEPHLFAGFSGGPKAVLPSLAGAESVFTNHGVKMLQHSNATWGITHGNPVWEEMLEMALRTRPDFLLNVAMNTRHEITGVFAGDLQAAHQAGCEFVASTAMVPFDEPFDVVLTTNSGYPLDQNLYQSIKGMSAAIRAVRPGGTIIMAAACQDGIPNHGRYIELLQQAGSPARILEMISAPGFSVQDQWQVQVQAMIQLHADVLVYADGLSDAQIRTALFEPCRNIEETIQRLLVEKGPRLCVIPDGPQVIPFLKSAGE